MTWKQPVKRVWITNGRSRKLNTIDRPDRDGSPTRLLQIHGRFDVDGKARPWAELSDARAGATEGSAQHEDLLRYDRNPVGCNSITDYTR